MIPTEIQVLECKQNGKLCQNKFFCKLKKVDIFQSKGVLGDMQVIVLLYISNIKYIRHLVIEVFL